MSSLATSPVVVRSAAEDGTWELFSCPPAAALSPWVLGYAGYVEHGDGPVRRRECPSGVVGLIISLGPTIDVALGAGGPPATLGSFFAGLHDTFAVTSHEGIQEGIEIRLTPVGASMLLGVPMRAACEQIVPLDELLGQEATRLVERVACCRRWDERFAWVDAWLLGRLADATTVVPWFVRSAVWRMEAASGAVRVADLVRESGRSPRHFAATFHEFVGVPPKVFARVLRFQRAVGLVSEGSASLADIALECGYYDQAHLNRDFRAFAGGPPTDYLARLGGLGVAD